MSHNDTFGGSIDDQTLAHAVAVLRGAASAHEPLHAVADAIERAAEASETGDSTPSNPQNSEDEEFEHVCDTCGKGFATAQALSGHKGGSGHGRSDGEAETGNSDDSTPSKDDIPVAADRAKQAYDTLAEASEAMREALREAGFGRDGWKVAFGDCHDPDCDLSAYGFEETGCKRHRDDSSEATEEAQSANELLVA